MEKSKTKSLAIYGTLGVLLFGAGLATRSGSEFLIAITTGPDLIQLASIMSLFLFLVVVNEQICEVVTTTIFGNEKRVFEVKDVTGTTLNPDRNKARVSKVICILFGLAVAASGFQFLTLTATALGVENLAGARPDADNPSQWRYIDTLITALILAGGAERFHQIMSSVLPKDVKKFDENGNVVPEGNLT